MSHWKIQGPRKSSLENNMQSDQASQAKALRKKPFLRKQSGSTLRKEASLQKPYIPKGGFIKTFEEITDSTPPIKKAKNR